MPRFMYPMSLRKIETHLKAMEEIKDGLIQAAPVAGYNKEIMNEAIDDIIWALVFLHKVHRTLSTWQKVGSTGGNSVQQRLLRSRLGRKP